GGEEKTENRSLFKGGGREWLCKANRSPCPAQGAVNWGWLRGRSGAGAGWVVVGSGRCGARPWKLSPGRQASYNCTRSLTEEHLMCAVRLALVAVVAACLGLAGRGPAAAGDDKPTAPATFEVEKHKDVAYRTDADADKERHKLDVYVPKGQKDFPVVMFVHGGSWKSGNKNLY